MNEILEQLQPHIRDIGRTTYYRKREQAVETLSSILWGYSSKDCLALLEDFSLIREEKFSSTIR